MPVHPTFKRRQDCMKKEKLKVIKCSTDYLCKEKKQELNRSIRGWLTLAQRHGRGESSIAFPNLRTENTIILVKEREAISQRNFCKVIVRWDEKKCFWTHSAKMIDRKEYPQTCEQYSRQGHISPLYILSNCSHLKKR